MLVFIDESGCPGFKTVKGSDPIFAVGMVIFNSSEDARATESCVAGLHAQLRHVAEFKFSKCRADTRDAFFAQVVRQPFAVRAILVEKEKLYSTHLRANVDAFYNYFVKTLMRFDEGRLQNAKVRIDGSGNREFTRALNAYLRRELPSAPLPEEREIALMPGVGRMRCDLASKIFGNTNSPKESPAVRG